MKTKYVLDTEAAALMGAYESGYLDWQDVPLFDCRLVELDLFDFDNDMSSAYKEEVYARYADFPADY